MGKKLMLLIITVVTVLFTVFILPEACAAGSCEINPAKSEFKAVKTTCNMDEAYYGYSSSGSVSIFKFTVEKNGVGNYIPEQKYYYDFYTTGTTDTVGALFKLNSGFFSNSYKLVKTYDEKEYNDDSENYDGDNTRNCKCTYQLSSGTYYFCVRAWSSNSGSYYAYMRLHRDVAKSKYGAKWVSDTIFKVTDSRGRYPISTEYPSGEYTYISKEQVKFMYQLYCNILVDKSVLKYYNKADSAEERILNISSVVLKTTGKALIKSGNPIGIVVGGGLFLIGFAVGCMDTTLSSNIKKISEWIGFFESQCGATRTTDYSTSTTKYDVTKGCLLMKYGVYGVSGTTRTTTLSCSESKTGFYNSSNKLYGQLGYMGKWTIYNDSEIQRDINYF